MAQTYDAIVIGGGHNGLVAGGVPGASPARAPSSWRAGTRPAAPPTPRRRGRRHPDIKVTRLSYVMSLMPPDDHPRPRAQAARLQGAPDGPVLPGVPRGRLDHRSTPTTPSATTRRSRSSRRRTPRRCRSGTRGSAGSPTCSARCCMQVPPNVGSHAARPSCPGCCGWPGGTRALDVRTVARRHAAVRDEHRRPARRLVRVAAGQGRAGRSTASSAPGRARASRAPRT